MITADLHNHTTASDGDLTPEELVSTAGKAGISAVGLTDHDTDAGIEKALAAGKTQRVQVVPGVEISVRFKEPLFTGTLHLLCYFSPQSAADPRFRAKLKEVVKSGRGEKLVRARTAEINRIFGPGGKTPLLERDLLYEDIAKYSSNATRRHFALALSEIHGITDKDEINRVIGNNSPAYLPSGIALEDIIPLAEKEPVLLVLAHPAAGSWPGEGHYREVLPPVETVEKLMPRFLDVGIKGIEVYYPGHTRSHTNLLLSWAKKYDLVVTGGSDCHDLSERPFGISGIGPEDWKKFQTALEQAGPR
ncbi:MAG: PHP domain-containing protein [Desulfarculaceae bacterium]|nr:PHP domain-containing protein [Desulfarculaceae bacterium]